MSTEYESKCHNCGELQGDCTCIKCSQCGKLLESETCDCPWDDESDMEKE